MVHSPRLIIYLAVKNYLTDNQLEELRTDLGAKTIKGDKKFLEIIKKHFNIELFRTNAFIWQDIWLYNYLMYDVKRSRFSRKGLVAKYEKEIIIPQEKILEVAKDLLLIIDN